MNKLLTLLPLALLVITGCNNNKQPSSTSVESISSSSISEETSSEESSGEDSSIDSSTSEEEVLPEGQVRIKMKGRNQFYSAIYSYDDSYFDKPSNELNKDLALFSLGASCASVFEDELLHFYNTLKFDDIFITDNYQEDKEDDICYGIAHRNNIIVCSLRGHDYKAEWANNFKLGESGDHVGFKQTTDIFLEGLTNYINKYHLNDGKLLITGYSRAGGIANMSADILLKKSAEEKLIPDENLYVYTFEAPRGLVTSEPYQNVINFVNSADPITYFAPEEYGLYRCGRDIELYDEKVSSLALAFSEDIVIPEFVPDEENYPTDIDFTKAVMTKLLSNNEYEYPLDSRENYVKNGQDTFCYVMKIIFSLKDETMTKISEDISNMGIIDLASLITDATKLKDFLKQYLDEDGYQYDEEELLSYCQNVINLITSGPVFAVLLLAMAAKENMSRMIYMHYIEVVYVLLNNYFQIA